MTLEDVLAYKSDGNGFNEHIGIKMTSLGDGYAEGELEVRDYHKNFIGSVHGGCLFTLADSIGGLAASGRGHRMTTVSGEFHFLRAAINSQKLLCMAKELKYGKKIAVYDVEISDEKGSLIAKGTFSYFNLGTPLSEAGH